MKAASRKPSDEMRLSNKEFDRIMGRVLQVKSKAEPKSKKGAKAKPRIAARKSRSAK